MSMDLTIRLLGRPKVSKDTQQGFQTMARKYVVQGPRASEQSLYEENNPLFLAVGTPDIEFTDHLLVDQRLEPADSMERAYLTRTFVKMREHWVTESVSESADLIKLTRTFIAIRGQINTYGYSPSAWAKHPNNQSYGVSVPKNTSEDPWDYAPENVLNGSPGNISYNNAEAGESGFSEVPYVEVEDSKSSLRDYLSDNSDEVNLGEWMRGSAQVNMAAPGVDVWSVSWVTHASPYWTFGTTKGGGAKDQSFTVVDFNHLGLKLTTRTVLGGGASVPLQAKTFNTFHIGETLPDHLAKIAGGTSVGSNPSPSVNLDFHIKIWQGRTVSFKQYLKNAVWTMNTTEHLSFPTRDGQNIQVGEKDPFILKFEDSPFIWDDAGQEYVDSDGNGLPLYQGSELAHIGGQITWSGTQKSLNSSGQTVLNSVSTKIAPIFRKGKIRVWKVQITYIG